MFTDNCFTFDDTLETTIYPVQMIFGLFHEPCDRTRMGIVDAKIEKLAHCHERRRHVVQFHKNQTFKFVEPTGVSDSNVWPTIDLVKADDWSTLRQSREDPSVVTPDRLFEALACARRGLRPHRAKIVLSMRWRPI